LSSRLRAVLIEQHGKLATDEIADAVGISRLRCQRILCPSAASLGAAVLAALQAWLDARVAPAKDTSEPGAGL
jgi:hypothetical protein